MRVFAASLLAIGLMASPLLAKNADETGKEDTPAAVTRASAIPDKPVSVKPESSAIESEVQDLRSLVEEQRAELEAQRTALKAEQLKMKALEEKLGVPPSEPVATPAVTSTAISAAPVSGPAAAPVTPAATATAAMSPQKAEESPLFFKIGGAEFYPLGFMDATNIFRTTNMTTQGGGSIGTSFGSIPFGNTVLGRDTEDKFSAQNSRIGLRTHAKFGDADVTGYLEADFLGYLAPSGNVTSNSDSLRLRLYWVDYRRGMWEVLGGQSWSLLTPNRNGLSALPGDLFYGQEMDTNYYLGLTYTRAAGVRVIAHPTKNWAIGVSLENPQQLLPSTVTLPSTVPAQFNVPGTVNVACTIGPTCPTGTVAVVVSAPNVYGNQFDTNSGNTSSTNGVNNTSIPNLLPDVIVKTAFDAVPDGHHVHFDVAGILRTFKALNLVQSTFNSPTGTTPVNSVYSTIHGGGVAYTLNVELVKNLRFINTGFYSYGGGRYIGNTSGPDLIVKADGSLSAIHSGSGLAGFEYQVTPKWMFYGYYSGAYFGKNVTAATAAGTGFAGYGFPGSNNSSDRYLYEPQIGFIQTMWRNPSYGDLKLITQYAYVSRTPWVVAGGQPATAHTSMVYIDLRYDLP
jgi:hypothetical protein